MKINILQRSEIDQIALEQWRQLSNDSVYVNPFFEPWCLVPAIRHLDKQQEVFIVTAYENGRLAALFPVALKSSRVSIRHFAIWKHSHCFLSNPLCLTESIVPQIIDSVAQQLSATIFQCKDHSPLPPDYDVNRTAIVIRDTRGAIFDTGQIRQHLMTLPKKQRAENKRLKKRLFELQDVSYRTSKDTPDTDWLKTYCSLEHSGWKSQKKGSIYSDPDVSCYYDNVHSEARRNGQIEFQGLFCGTTTLAASFRIISRNTAFELKTSYNEEFGKYKPGVVLELMNMEAFDDSNYESVDSCTNSDNQLVNRLWPDRREIWNSFYFSDSVVGTILKPVLSATIRLKPFFHRKK